MKRLLYIFGLFLSLGAGAQCDTTGILLELQATTNLEGILLAHDRCLTSATVLSPLYVSGDTIYLDTTGLGGGGGTQVIDTFTIVSNTLRLSLSGDGQPFKSVNLSPYLDNTDAQNLSLAGQSLGISGGTGVTLPLIGVGAGVGISVVTSSGTATVTNTGDLSDTNEGALTVKAATSTSSIISSNTSGGTDVEIIAGSGLSITENTGLGTITLTNSHVANNGLSDNENGGDFRLGNRYMNSSDGLFSFDRKINVNAFKLYIGDNTDSTLIMIDGTNDRVGINTTAASRTLHVNGEVRITDLSTTTTTLLVGADANGDLQSISVGTGLSLSANTLSSTVTSYTDEQAQDAVGTILTDGSIIDFTYNDAANTITATVINNSIGNAQLRQGAARSVIGVTGNATANVADIQGTTDQVLRVNSAGTALAFGRVATGGITDAAVTYAKIQSAVSNNVVLGNNTGAGTTYEELDVTALYTLLGLSGVDQRIAVWKGTNVLGNDAGLTFDYANDRQTINCDLPGSGAGAAALNIANVGTDATGEFLQMRGNMSANMIAGMYNVNNANAAANAIWVMSSGGSAAGDAFLQFTVSGQMTHSVGIDNTDDRFKITPNSATPGGTGNMGIIVRDNSGTGNTGINKDFPAFPLDGLGMDRFEVREGTGNLYLSSNVTFGTGAGTGPIFGTGIGTGNSFTIVFTTGTAPVADGDIITVTYPFAYTTQTQVVFSAGNKDGAAAGKNAATDITKFRISNTSANNFTLKANGTLAASTQYGLSFLIYGY